MIWAFYGQTITGTSSFTIEVGGVHDATAAGPARGDLPALGGAGGDDPAQFWVEVADSEDAAETGGENALEEEIIEHLDAESRRKMNEVYERNDWWCFGNGVWRVGFFGTLSVVGSAGRVFGSRHSPGPTSLWKYGVSHFHGDTSDQIGEVAADARRGCREIIRRPESAGPGRSMATCFEPKPGVTENGDASESGARLRTD